MGRVLVGNLRGPQGDSAYQVAVKNGYTGTEVEWLAVLASGSIIDPITNLPPKPVLDALSEAVLSEHVNDPTPHPAYDSIKMVDKYRLGKI